MGTYHVEDLVPVDCDAVCKLDALGSLAEDLVLVIILEDSCKDAKCCVP